jgi:hypothetical protein
MWFLFEMDDKKTCLLLMNQLGDEGPHVLSFWPEDPAATYL